MVGSLRIQFQRLRHGLEHLRGRAVFAPLFQPDVVVGTDSGEQRDFLSAQSRHPTSPVFGETDVVRLEASRRARRKSPKGVPLLTWKD